MSECQSQDSQHLNSSSSQHSTIIIMDSQADKTVARSISHLSLRYTATTTISLFFRFSIAPFITAILVVRARHSRHTRAARRQSRAPAGSRHHFESECHERRLEVAGNRGRLCLCRRARPLVPCLSLCLIYMASSVPVPSRDESSPLPEPPRADEAVCNSPLALESSPAPPLEAIDPARLFVNREGGSPPRPRLQGMRTWLFTRGAKDGCQSGGSGTKSR